MRIGLDVAQHQLSWDELLARVRFAEDAGFDGVWVFDHFQPLYGDPDGPCLEGWSLLAALAVETSRVRLGTMVTGITHRHPSVLAAQAVTIDHISGGRLEVALGAAWNDDEHAELGIAFPPMVERAARLEEAIKVIRSLMTDDPATFEGEYYQLDDASYYPRPIQRPTPPIWIGAEGEKLMMPLVARQADVWHTYGEPDELARRSAKMDDLAESYARDPGDILRATDLSISDDLDDARKIADQVAQLGFSYLVVSWPTEGWGRVEEFTKTVLPELQAR